MSIRAPYRYQLSETRRAVIIYYIVVLAVWALLGLGISSLHTATVTVMGVSTNTSYVNFFSASSIVFLFVVGLNTFKDNFGMLSQNGVSRKSMFLSRCAVAGTLAVGMAAIDTLLSFLMTLVFRLMAPVASSGTFVDTASLSSAAFPSLSGPVGQVAQFFFLVFGYYLALTIGFCITILFYRLNAAGKIIVGAGVPVLLMIVLPLVDAYLLQGAIERAMDNFGFAYKTFMMSNPFLHLLAPLMWGAVFSAIAWLLMRRAIVRK